MWEYYIGGKQARSKIYRSWITNYLRSHGVQTILDVACGTGIDSCMLLEVSKIFAILLKIIK